MGERGAIGTATNTPATPRVLYVLGSLDPRTGGPAQSAPHMWIAARRAGINVTAAFIVGDEPDDSVKMQARLNAEGVRLHPFPVFSGLLQFRRWGVSWRLALWLIRHAKDHDIIHSHGAWMFSSFVALLVAVLYRKHFILTPHESLTKGDVEKGARTIAALIKQAIKQLYITTCTSILFASFAEKSASVDSHTSRRRDVLYHPVIDDRVKPRAIVRKSNSPPALTVGYLGRFDPKKNLELLITALEQCPDVTLRIAGGGERAYEKQLRDLTSGKSIAQRVAWLGFISASARADFFASIDVLAMPSVFEGFGMVAAEALGYGVPVIVTRACGIAELVTKYDCGIVTDATVKGVIEAIKSLQQKPHQLAAFSVRGLEMTQQELTFSVFGVKLSELYRSIGPCN